MYFRKVPLSAIDPHRECEVLETVKTSSAPAEAS